MLTCLFQGKRISLYKRAQILVADFWGVMEARGEGDIIDMDWLTMFADYRVPQVLVYLGALRYSDALMQALKKGETGVRSCACFSGHEERVCVMRLSPISRRRAAEFKGQERGRDTRLFDLVCGADQRPSS